MEHVCRVLRSQVSEATWKTWFEGIRPMTADDRGLALAVPSSLVKERLEGRYLGLVEHAVAAALGSPVQIRIDVRTDDGPTGRSLAATGRRRSAIRWPTRRRCSPARC